MKPVTIYTTPFCPYCIMAKRLLARKGAAFERSTSAATGRLARPSSKRPAAA
jgi:glutaredoxin 3